MSRIYECDRCRTKFGTWATTNVEIPTRSWPFGKEISVDLCDPCLVKLRAVIKAFMEEID